MMTECIKPVNVKTGKSVVHSFEDHNFWIDRNGICPYCNSGSKPVHKSLLLVEVDNGEID